MLQDRGDLSYTDFREFSFRSGMTLREYLKNKGETLDSFSKRSGVPVSSLGRSSLPLDHPDYGIPRRENMKKIIASCDGLVGERDFYGVGVVESAA